MKKMDLKQTQDGIKIQWWTMKFGETKYRINRIVMNNKVLTWNLSKSIIPLDELLKGKKLMEFYE